MSYSVIDLFINASLVVQLVIFLLLLASIFSWMVIFERWIFLNKSKEELVRFEDLFWSDAGLEAVFDQGEDENHVSIGAERIFRSGYQEYKNIKSQDLEPETVLEGAERAMRISLSREQTALEKHLPFLATVASASPYVGLFGTVWGIMNAFIEIAQQQNTNLAVVAPGIAEALLATGLGLLAAIPAVVFYNKLNADCDRLVAGYESFADEFSTILNRQLDS